MSLTASGFPGRWNSKGAFMIYTSGSRALASLENIVHRSGEGLNANFKVMVISIPDDLLIEEITLNELHFPWTDYSRYSYCQRIGDNWLSTKTSAVLKVPSAIIKNEYNYLLNPNHIDFEKTSILRVEDFKFDSQIK